MEIISVADLKVGMFVAEPDCSWGEFSFALQGFVLTRQDQIDQFQKKCRFVSIDRSRSLNEHYAAPKKEKDPGLKGGNNALVVDEAELRRQRRDRFLQFLHSQDDNDEARDLSRELAWVEPRFDDFTRAWQQSMEALVNGREIDIDAVRNGVRDISVSLKRNADAVMWLLRLKTQDEYSFDHALDVSVNMMLLGTHIGIRGEALLSLGLAGLMQDVGKIELPADLLAREGPLTPDEKLLVRSHVASSLEILISQRGMPAEVMTIVSRHHERWDGSGYPRGLRYEAIGMPGEIAGLADSYCAMVKDKPYRNALGHQEAVEELYAQRGKQFGPALMEQFVQCVGLYPIGCLVEMDNGEVGVIVQHNRVQRARPRILLMLDRDKQPSCSYQIIDLRAPENAQRRIAKSLPAHAYGLMSNDYYLG